MYGVLQKNKNAKEGFDFKEICYRTSDRIIIAFVPISLKRLYMLGVTRSYLNPWSSHDRNPNCYGASFRTLSTYRVKGSYKEVVGISFITDSPFIMKIPRHSKTRHWVPYKGNQTDEIWKQVETLLIKTKLISEEDIIQNKLGNYLCSLLD